MIKFKRKKKITEGEFKHLKKCKYIEGRKPNIYLSHDIVVSVNNEELKREYLDNRSFDDSHFKKLILEYLRTYGSCKRDKIDNLIIPKLSTALSEEKKRNKVTNYLSSLRMEGKIVILQVIFGKSFKHF